MKRKCCFNSMLKNRFGIDIVYMALSKVVAFVFFFATDIYCARRFSYAQYDEWSFFYSVISVVFWIVWFGINASTRVRVAKRAETPAQQSDCIRAAIEIRFFTSTVLCLLFLCIAKPLATALGYPTKYPHLLAMFYCGSILAYFNSFAEFFKELFIGLTDFAKQFYVSLCEHGAIFLFAYIVFSLKTPSPVVLTLTYTVAYVFAALVGMGLTLQLIQRNKSDTGTSQLLFEYGKEIVRYARAMLMLSVGALILIEIDSIMLGIICVGDVGIYSVAKKIVSKASHVNLALASVAMPSFAVLNKSTVVEKREYYKKMIRINLIIVFLFSFVFFQWGDKAIAFVYGDAFVASSRVLKALIPYYAFSSVALFSGLLMDYQDQANRHAAYYFLTVIVDLLLNILLIPRWGAMGAAVATSISMIPFVVLLEISRKKIFCAYTQHGGDIQ